MANFNTLQSKQREIEILNVFVFGVSCKFNLQMFANDKTMIKWRSKIKL